MLTTSDMKPLNGWIKAFVRSGRPELASNDFDYLGQDSISSALQHESKPESSWSQYASSCQSLIRWVHQIPRAINTLDEADSADLQDISLFWL